MKHDEIEIRSLGLAILLNFPHFCGEERTKEAYAIYEELKRLAEIGRATERMFEVFDKVECTVVCYPVGEPYENIVVIPCVDDLLEWAKGE